MASAPQKKRSREEEAAAREAASSSDDSESSDGEIGGIPLTGTLSENDESELSSSSEEEPAVSNQGVLKKNKKKKKKDDLVVTFEFKDPSSFFAPSIKAMLRKYPCCTDLNSLSESIAEQPVIGTLIVQEEMDDLFAFISTLNAREGRNLPCLNQIREFLITKCPPSEAASLHAVLNGNGSKGLGILIREQMVISRHRDFFFFQTHIIFLQNLLLLLAE